jgi:hypothetical protein
MPIVPPGILPPPPLALCLRHGNTSQIQDTSPKCVIFAVAWALLTVANFGENGYAPVLSARSRREVGLNNIGLAGRGLSALEWGKASKRPGRARSPQPDGVSNRRGPGAEALTGVRSTPGPWGVMVAKRPDHTSCGCATEGKVALWPGLSRRW